MKDFAAIDFETANGSRSSVCSVGIVIVKDGKIIARAHNLKETKFDTTKHAEILAIQKASKKLNSWRLLDCEMYVTLEPCSMCAGALINSRIKKVYIGANDEKTAKTVAKSVICSSLLKAAMFGADANWGRVLCAIGYSGAEVDVLKVDVSFSSKKGEIAVCKNGAGVDFSEEKAKEILLEDEIEILVGLNSGDASATAWGCDLTYDYVKINGDYRT